MAAKTINQKITITGGDEIARTLRDLARLGEQAFAQLADAARKIDLNLPVDKVKEQLVELGRSGQQAFAQLAEAAERSVASINQVGTASQGAAKGVAEISPAAQKAAQDVASIGPAAQTGLGGVQQQASAASSAISGIGTAVKVVGATLGALAATFTGLAVAATAMGKSASDSVISIGRAADAAGVSVSNFSRANILLQQFGLTADQSAAAIKRLGEAGTTAFNSAVQSMQGLNRAGGETTTALQRALSGTQQTLEQIARTGTGAAERVAQGAKVIVNEVALQNEETRAKFATQMSAMADITINGKRVLDEGTAAILRFGLAFDPLSGKLVGTTQQLTLFAEGIARMRDPAQQAATVNTLFGESIGKVLLPALRQGSTAFVNMINTIDRLRLGVTDAEKKVGQDFRAAWDLLHAVLKKNNEEIGLLIAKPLTPFIVKFAEAMRTSSDTFKLFEAAIKGITPLLDQLLKSFEGVGQIDAGFLKRVEQGVREFGEAVVAVFSNVIVPAFNSLKTIATETAGALSTLFGTKVTPTMVALGAVFTALLGPIKALGVALLAVFGGQGAGFDKFRQNLAQFGIDIDGISARFKQGLGVEAPNVLNILIQSFEGLLAVLRGVTGAVNVVFGTDFSTTAVGAAFAVGVLTGAFEKLAPVFVIVAAGLTAMVSAVNLAILAFTGIAALIGWPVTLAATIVILVTNFESLSKVLDIVARALNALTGTNWFTGEGLSIALIAGLTAAFIRLGFAVGLVQAALVALAATPAIAALLTLAAIIQDITRKADPAQKKLEEINKEFARTGDVDAYNRAMKEFDDTQRRVGSGAGIDVGDMWRRMKAEADKAIAGIVGTSDSAATTVGNQWNTAAQKVTAGFREIRPGVWEKIATDAKGATDKIVENAVQTAKKVDAAYRQIRPGVFERIVAESKQTTATVTADIQQMQTRLAESFRALEAAPAAAQADALRDALNRAAEAARRLQTEADQLAIEDDLSDGDAAVDELTTGFSELNNEIEKIGDIEISEEPLVSPFRQAQTEIVAILDAIKAKIAEVGQAIQQLLSGGGTVAAEAPEAGGGAPAEQGAGAGGGGLAGIGQQIVAALDQALAQLAQMASTTVQNIAAAFQQLGPQIAAALGATGDPFQPLIAQAQNAVNFIIQIFGQLAQAATAPFQSMASAADAAMGGISQVVSSGFESMMSVIQSVAQQIDGIVQQIISSLQAAAAEAQRLAAAAQAAASAAAPAGSGSGFARGGYTGDVGTRRVAGVVHGGEYVEPAHVVRQPGVRAFLETLRRVGNLREALRRFSKGFSVGGFVDDLASRMSGALVPGYAAGGLVPQPAVNAAPRNLGVLRLDVGGEKLQVMTDESTAFKLQRFARRQLMTSGGRAPVWER